MGTPSVHPALPRGELPAQSPGSSAASLFLSIESIESIELLFRPPAGAPSGQASPRTAGFVMFWVFFPIGLIGLIGLIALVLN